MFPYIGISDFLNFKQVQKMLVVFNKHFVSGSERQLHVGAMVSYKTLHGLPTKWQKVFPPKETIAGIFSSYATYNCLHYADYDSSPDFWRSLSIAISFGGIGIQAVQLDMVWPDPGQIAQGVHTSRKVLEVILQINGKALDQVDNNP